ENKSTYFYFILIGLFSVLIYFFMKSGSTHEKFADVTQANNLSFLDQVSNTLLQNLHHPLAILLLQIITIIFTARTFGFLINKIGQPTVIGEILAGIFLGPSFMGYWFPEYSNFLFPLDSLSNLQFLSQVGLVLFMFVIGMELDLKILKNNFKEALVISHSAIIISYSLGLLLAYFIYDTYAPENIKFSSFALFMGIAMSITAFPVLARILQERDLTKTKLGSLIITCAAIDDITAWCILAVVIAIVKAGAVVGALLTIVLALLYLLVMLKFVQPFVKKLGEVYSNKESLSLNIVAIVFGILLISSYATELIGIHALFGAFLAGVIMPQSIGFRRILIERVESVSLGLFIPLFFVITGLRTQIGLLNQAHLWGTCLLVITLAVTGKFGGGLIAGRVTGQSWKDSLSIGALMNTRGLMELIVLNIGFDLGILKPEIFAIMVIMALVTTFMTGPMLDLINWFYRKEILVKSAIEKSMQKFRILISFANPQSGKKLARISALFMGKAKESTTVTALHITPTADINKYQLSEYEKESFRPIKSEASKLNIDISTSYKVSNDVSEEILAESNSGNYDFMIVGVGQSLFAGSLLGQFIGITTKALNPDTLIGAIRGRNSLFRSKGILDEKSLEFINNSKTPVGIFIDHDMEQVNTILLPIVSISDIFLFFYAKKLVKNSAARVTLFDIKGVIESNSEIIEEITNLKSTGEDRVELLQGINFKKSLFIEYDLVVLSIEGYKQLADQVDFRDEEISSLLLI
ncbi:MAG: cation:proton antiporter, partial [Bacteroidota bacterium]